MITYKVMFFILVTFLLTGTSSASTLTVGQGQEYSTIQSAIDASGTGDVITVSEGIYSENVVLTKSGIAIIGKNKEKTIIDGKKTGSVIRIETDEITISGFTIQNNGGSGKEDAGVSLYNANKNMIANSIFTNNNVGIAIYSSSNNNIVAGNQIRSNGRNGINIYSSLDNKIYENQIQGNQIGIYADSARGSRIYGNNFIDNKDQAYDNSEMNSWDNGKSGNFWNTHKTTGPFNILGGAKAKDNYPLSNAVTIRDVPITIPTPIAQGDKTGSEKAKSTPGFEVMLFIIVIGMLGYRIRKN
ncbi:MAG: pectinesterase family protein [Candidatus Methanoperedens sp.]|nr:pectinesterase family protein [Candidatus Methanoperedens sp.]